MHKHLLATALGLSLATLAHGETAQESWLHRTLPAETAAYARVPGVWFLEQNALPTSAVYQSEAYKNQSQLIRKALQEKLLTLLPPEAANSLRPLQEHLTSPLEAAFITDNHGMTILIASHIEQNSAQDIQKTLQQVFPAPWQVSADRIQNSAEKNAPIIAYRFDDKQKRLLLAINSDNQPDAQVALIDKNDGNAPFTAQENRLDPEHNGLYLWANPQNPLIQMGISRQQGILQKLGLDRVQQASLAWAAAEGRPRLQLSLILPDNAPLNLPAATANNLGTLHYHGDVAALAAFTLPNDAQLDAILDSNGELKKNLQQALGVSADDLAALGTLHYLSDDNGRYLVLPQSAKPALNSLLDKLQQKGHLKNRSMGRDNIEHLAFVSLANLISEGNTNSPDPSKEAFLALLFNIQNHYYLRDEGDNLLIATLPQPLAARAKAGDSAPKLGDWLKTQHLNLDGVNYAYIQNQRNLSRDSYYEGLRRLQMYADLAGTPLDLSQLPDAESANLPQQGTIALRLSGGGSNPTLSLDLQNGLDDLASLASGTPVIAMFGIASAIALPAYQDYTVRAEVSRPLYETAALREAIASEAPAKAGKKGQKKVAKNYAEYIPGEHVRVENDDIHITMKSKNRSVDGKTITLHYDRAGKTWQCKTTLSPRYLPLMCR